MPMIAGAAGGAAALVLLATVGVYYSRGKSAKTARHRDAKGGKNAEVRISSSTELYNESTGPGLKLRPEELEA